MSAVCGVFPFQSNNVLKNDITLMMDSLAYYGLDGANLWRDEIVALGQQNLNISEESFYETLPLNDVGSNLTVAADIRLDNRTELFQKLEIPSANRGGYGDGQLLLGAYQKWGEGCVEHLLGDFAFAVWDNNQRKIFLARDHLGRKPLFYYKDAEKFIFASEPKAILAVSGVDNRINKNKLGALAFPRGELLFPEESWFENIFPLMPATSLTVDVWGNISKRTFWQPQIEKQLPFKREDEILEAFRELIFEAVKDRLRSKFPVTALLSGGLDSSAIVSIAAKVLEKQNKQLHTLSAVLPDDKDPVLEDERCFINQFQTFQNVSINYVTDTERGPFDDLEELVWAIDMPLESSRHYLYSAFAEYARKRGSRIILDGQGGEAGPTFHGWGCYAEMFLHFKWLRLLRELKLRKKLSGESIQYNLRANVIQPILPDFIYNIRHPQRQNSFVPVRNYPLQDSFANDMIEHITPKLKDFDDFSDRFSPFHKRNQSEEIINQQKIASIGIAGFVGSKELEFRFPLMDKRLLEFCLAVPCSLKIRNGYQRYLIRAGLDKILPPKIQWRTSKKPFSPDYFRRYKRQIYKILDFLQDIQLTDPIRQVIDIERLKNSAKLSIEDDDYHTPAGEVARDFVPLGIYLIYFLRRFPEFQK